MARSSDRVRCEGVEKIGMTKLQEFILSISNQKDEMSGLPAYSGMTADAKRLSKKPLRFSQSMNKE